MAARRAREWSWHGPAQAMCPNSGWRLAGPASDFVIPDVCCIWNTQDMTEAPLVKSIDSSTGSGYHTPRVCTIEEYREYVHIVKSDLGVQTNGGMPNVTSLQASAGHLDPPVYISFASSSYVNARSKIDKRVDNLNIMTKYRHLRWLAYVFIEHLYFGFGPVDL